MAQYILDLSTDKVILVRIKVALFLEEIADFMDYEDLAT